MWIQGIVLFAMFLFQCGNKKVMKTRHAVVTRAPLHKEHGVWENVCTEEE
jgi:hypothetical protein